MNLIDIRQFFAEEIRAVANIQTDALATAFAKVPREHFLGLGPWQIASPDARGSSIGGTAIGTTLLHAPTFPLTSRLPSICSALTKGVSLFADFVSTTRLSDFLRPFIIVVRPWTSRCDPGMRAWVVAGFPGSRAGCGLPLLLTGSASRIWISRLNTQPALSPVNASPSGLLHSTHDSGSSWLAKPLTFETFIQYNLPVYPGAQGETYVQ